MSRENDFFSGENLDRKEKVERREYFIKYIKRNHEKYDIRQVQVDHVIELSQSLFGGELVGYFETLPSSFKKAFLYSSSFLWVPRVQRGSCN